MIVIDGSQGEGGGQVLRSALSLSVATGRPFRIEKLRAGRRKPGLMRQHLTAVEAATAIGSAKVDGAALGSRELEFRPARLTPGRHELRVGTAGAATLVLQAAIPPLLLASEPSEIVVDGGTHVSWSPPAEFLRDCLAPLLSRMGAKVEVEIDRHGFYPAGGGRLVARVTPSDGTLRPLHLQERGELRTRRARSLCSRIPAQVAKRELAAVQAGLSWTEDSLGKQEITDAPGPGNALVLTIAGDEVTEVFSAIGGPGRSSEAVAAEAVGYARRWLAAGVPVGEHLADQLMVPMALAGAGSFRSLPPSSHSRTNDDVLRLFVDEPLGWTKNEDRSWTWSVGTPAAS